MTAITPSVAANLFETTGRRPLACIGNPVQYPDTPPQIDINKVRSKAVCIARLETVKGHRHLLAAWKMLCDRGYKYQLNLIGEGSLRADLEAQVRRDGTHEVVRFYGFTAETESRIQDCLFAILVSEWEGQGIVTLEAAASGRPSLLTAVPGSVDLLPPGRSLKNGLEFGNVEQLADTLEEWFSDPRRVLQEGERFFQFLKGTSEPAAIAGKYTDVYRTIVEGTLPSCTPPEPGTVQSGSI
jgi:glycosyltransferase involved in cell wall biosynthesis